MLHALISTRYGDYHFIGDVNGYNLQTLRQHAAEGCRAGGTVRLRLHLDADDEPAFARHSGRWLPQLAALGTVVEFEAESDVQPHSSTTGTPVQ